MEYFEKRHLGDIYSRFGSLEVIQRTMTTSFLAALIDGVLVIATVVLMFVYSPLLAFITIIAVVLYGLLRAVIYHPLRSASEETLVRRAKQQSNFLETVRGVQSIKLFSRESQRQTLYENLLIDRANADIKTKRITITFSSANLLIFGIEKYYCYLFWRTPRAGRWIFNRNAVCLYQLQTSVYATCCRAN